MERPIAFTPPWLVMPSPGRRMFLPRTPATGKPSQTRHAPQGEKPKRTIVVHDSEIFVAVGNEIRWTDVQTLRQAVTQSHPEGFIAHKACVPPRQSKRC